MDKHQSNEELFRRFLDGELNKEEEKQALHLAAENDEMREMLHFERTLFQTFSGEPDPGSFTVPENFADDVMKQLPVQDSRQKEESGSVSERSKSWWQVLFIPRPVALRPVYTLAAVLLFLFGTVYILQIQSQESGLASADFESSAQPVSESGEEIWIRFIYFDDEAEKIEVAGDFSNWDPVELEQETVGDKKVWTGLVPVSRGEHRYMFVKNGEEWVADPLASVQRNDGFGNKNSVLYL